MDFLCRKIHPEDYIILRFLHNILYDIGCMGYQRAEICFGVHTKNDRVKDSNI